MRLQESISNNHITLCSGRAYLLHLTFSGASFVKHEGVIFNIFYDIQNIAKVKYSINQTMKDLFLEDDRFYCVKAISFFIRKRRKGLGKSDRNFSPQSHKRTPEIVREKR